MRMMRPRNSYHTYILANIAAANKYFAFYRIGIAAISNRYFVLFQASILYSCKEGDPMENNDKLLLNREASLFTAKYRTVQEKCGFRLTFFCEICGSGYTTPLIACDTPEEALRLGGENARFYFNRCRCCHRWVCDQHYNENQMMCTDCAPRICIRCQAAMGKEDQYCTACGAAKQ